MELVVLNQAGEDTGKKVALNDSIYAIEPNDHAIYLDVKQYLANQRQGTHKSKERGEVAGSTRKLKKQKGTGTARAGSIKSPVFRGGGRVFGPKVRDYSFKLNKKVKRLARVSALTYKAKQNQILIIEDFNMDAPKTKMFSSMLENLKISDKKSLVVVSEQNKNIYLSSRNLKGAEVITADNLNTYQIMKASSIVITEKSVGVIETILG
ncbi:MAG TPA: 50S ribosomal protein L4 [Marinilabiliales bacterium]|jgi:large subunit ribosomal protein L4|nr:MAG: 50S ribosomal protein L4 [Bacteroidetes bacterium GWA2_40_14]OFX62634.1 MAG: 50S ribosomal protein L4 [Bacteroidetes bacterium GWC2_40_13]OFX74370.1 MAG: 50S ribosomal protein L4 [Bacteroidetes bacterium GWD2_40_43]OFX95217.1 MAG: 50S ribosomal protein L4 [Bacteroidetes bacterium GWE2_40_63]OFY21109.1 MAG: 50S ribosomal protein L4 [Bacteroidetes bacterium GWF2_40_13]OFZ30883.1 MAG: 50S ribosomal protein L4 [Bacteroidetes bacterium RIFOXYC2_FULL_40_12]HAM97374.1 50S ribosomal protein L